MCDLIRMILIHTYPIDTFNQFLSYLDNHFFITIAIIYICRRMLNHVVEVFETSSMATFKINYFSIVLNTYIPYWQYSSFLVKRINVCICIVVDIDSSILLYKYEKVVTRKCRTIFIFAIIVCKGKLINKCTHFYLVGF